LGVRFAQAVTAVPVGSEDRHLEDPPGDGPATGRSRLEAAAAEAATPVFASSRQRPRDVRPAGLGRVDQRPVLRPPDHAVVPLQLLAAGDGEDFCAGTLYTVGVPVGALIDHREVTLSRLSGVQSVT
jgi:hypothetical protein